MDMRRRLHVRLAGDADREVIYRMRHDAYAVELGQHSPNGAARLTDALDDHSDYLVAHRGEEVAGFVSVTRPEAARLSIDKYFARDDLPFVIDDSVAEVRLLTVARAHRGTSTAAVLMFAALQFVQRRGAERVVAIGRHELLPMYEYCGLTRVGLRVRSGAVEFELLTATVDNLAARAARAGWLGPVMERTEWARSLGPPSLPHSAVGCFHGGESFTAIGTGFDALHRSRSVINADVLDAWFPPAPAVIDVLTEYLPWLARTSPPTDAPGLVRAIGEHRGVAESGLLVGAGSSALIFLAFGRWLTSRSRVLMMDPTYGEYAHVLDKVIGCRTDRLVLDPERDFDPDLDGLAERAAGYDLVVIVNPNNPTGRHVPGDRLRAVLAEVPARTTVWIDETYIDFVDPGDSCEQFAASNKNVVVVKSMSKVYALSGMRVGYLCGPTALIEPLRTWTPPWAVSLPAQIAAVHALGDREYYQQRWDDTKHLRHQLDHDLRAFGLQVTPGSANFLLCRLPDHAPPAAELTASCAASSVYLRDISTMSSRPTDRYVRIAVKDAPANDTIVRTIATALG